MNKPFHLGLSILKLSKMLIYEFWYDYVKPKYDNRIKYLQKMKLTQIVLKKF